MGDRCGTRYQCASSDSADVGLDEAEFVFGAPDLYKARVEWCLEKFCCGFCDSSSCKGPVHVIKPAVW